MSLVRERLALFAGGGENLPTPVLSAVQKERRLSKPLQEQPAAGEQSQEPPSPSLAAARASVKARASAFSGDAAAEDGAAANLTEALERVGRADPALDWLDLSGNRQLLALSSARRRAALEEMGKGLALRTLILNSLRLDNGDAEAVAALLAHTTTLEGLSLEGNLLTDAGLGVVAAALRAHPSLTELSVANQARPLSTEATALLLDAFDETPNLQMLGLGVLRDDRTRRRHAATTARHVEAARLRRHVAATGAGGGAAGGAAAGGAAGGNGGGAGGGNGGAGVVRVARRSASFSRPTRRRSEAKGGEGERRPPRNHPPAASGNLVVAIEAIGPTVERLLERTARVADWEEEARRISHSEPPQYGAPEAEEAAPAAAPAAAPPQGARRGANANAARYVLTGSALWARATKAEKERLVDAFGTNRAIRTVSLAGALVNDALAKRWAEVLCVNETITSLNLESNAIGTAGIEALAEALRTCSSLVEIKLANQRGGSVSQLAELAFASALEECGSLTRLTLDLRSTRARDLIGKYLGRNQEADRARRRAAATAATAAPAEPAPALAPAAVPPPTASQPPTAESRLTLEHMSLQRAAPPRRSASARGSQRSAAAAQAAVAEAAEAEAEAAEAAGTTEAAAAAAAAPSGGSGPVERGRAMAERLAAKRRARQAEVAARRAEPPGEEAAPRPEAARAADADAQPPPALQAGPAPVAASRPRPVRRANSFSTGLRRAVRSVGWERKARAEAPEAPAPAAAEPPAPPPPEQHPPPPPPVREPAAAAPSALSVVSRVARSLSFERRAERRAARVQRRMGPAPELQAL